MRSSTETLIEALEILSRDIQSGDGIANAAIAEAANRLRELHEANKASISFSALDGMVEAENIITEFSKTGFNRKIEPYWAFSAGYKAAINAIKGEAKLW